MEDGELVDPTLDSYNPSLNFYRPFVHPERVASLSSSQPYLPLPVPGTFHQQVPQHWNLQHMHHLQPSQAPSVQQLRQQQLTSRPALQHRNSNPPLPMSPSTTLAQSDDDDMDLSEDAPSIRSVRNLAAQTTKIIPPVVSQQSTQHVLSNITTLPVSAPTKKLPKPVAKTVIKNAFAKQSRPPIKASANVSKVFTPQAPLPPSQSAVPSVQLPPELSDFFVVRVNDSDSDTEPRQPVGVSISRFVELQKQAGMHVPSRSSSPSNDTPSAQVVPLQKSVSRQALPPSGLPSKVPSAATATKSTLTREEKLARLKFLEEQKRLKLQKQAAEKLLPQQIELSVSVQTTLPQTVSATVEPPTVVSNTGSVQSEADPTIPQAVPESAASITASADLSSPSATPTASKKKRNKKKKASANVIDTNTIEVANVTASDLGSSTVDNDSGSIEVKIDGQSFNIVRRVDESASSWAPFAELGFGNSSQQSATEPPKPSAPVLAVPEPIPAVDTTSAAAAAAAAAAATAALTAQLRAQRQKVLAEMMKTTKLLHKQAADRERELLSQLAAIRMEKEKYSKRVVALEQSSDKCDDIDYDISLLFAEPESIANTATAKQPISNLVLPKTVPSLIPKPAFKRTGNSLTWIAKAPSQNALTTTQTASRSAPSVSTASSLSSPALKRKFAATMVSVRTRSSLRLVRVRSNPTTPKSLSVAKSSVLPMQFKPRSANAGGPTKPSLFSPSMRTMIRRRTKTANSFIRVRTPTAAGSVANILPKSHVKITASSRVIRKKSSRTLVNTAPKAKQNKLEFKAKLLTALLWKRTRAVANRLIRSVSDSSHVTINQIPVVGVDCLVKVAAWSCIDSDVRTRAWQGVISTWALLNQEKSASNNRVGDIVHDSVDSAATAKYQGPTEAAYQSPLLQFHAYSQTNNFQKLKPQSRSAVGKLDPNVILCSFDLAGTCKDKECKFQHARDYMQPANQPTVEADASLSSILSSNLKVAASNRNTKLDKPVEHRFSAVPKLQPKPVQPTKNTPATTTTRSQKKNSKVEANFADQPDFVQLANSGSAVLLPSDSNIAAIVVPDVADCSKLGPASVSSYWEPVVSQSPHDIDSWFSYFNQLSAALDVIQQSDPQNVSIASAFLDSKLALLSRALEHNPSSERMWVTYIDLFAQHSSTTPLQLCRVICIVAAPRIGTTTAALWTRAIKHMTRCTQSSTVISRAAVMFTCVQAMRCNLDDPNRLQMMGALLLQLFSFLAQDGMRQSLLEMAEVIFSLPTALVPSETSLNLLFERLAAWSSASELDLIVLTRSVCQGIVHSLQHSPDVQRCVVIAALVSIAFNDPSDSGQTSSIHQLPSFTYFESIQAQIQAWWSLTDRCRDESCGFTVQWGNVPAGWFETEAFVDRIRSVFNSIQSAIHHGSVTLLSCIHVNRYLFERTRCQVLQILATVELEHTQRTLQQFCVSDPSQHFQSLWWIPSHPFDEDSESCANLLMYVVRVRYRAWSAWCELILNKCKDQQPVQSLHLVLRSLQHALECCRANLDECDLFDDLVDVSSASATADSLVDCISSSISTLESCLFRAQRHLSNDQSAWTLLALLYALVSGPAAALLKLHDAHRTLTATISDSDSTVEQWKQVISISTEAACLKRACFVVNQAANDSHAELLSLSSRAVAETDVKEFISDIKRLSTNFSPLLNSSCSNLCQCLVSNWSQHFAVDSAQIQSILAESFEGLMTCPVPSFQIPSETALLSAITLCEQSNTNRPLHIIPSCALPIGFQALRAELSAENLKMAIRTLSQLVSIAPTLDLAWLCLSLLHKCRGETEVAKSVLQRGCASAPTSKALHDEVFSSRF